MHTSSVGPGPWIPNRAWISVTVVLLLLAAFSVRASMRVFKKNPTITTDPLIRLDGTGFVPMH